MTFMIVHIYREKLAEDGRTKIQKFEKGKIIKY